jgi:hypothetical protein
MPFGSFVNDLPPILFLLIHTVLFLGGAFFAMRAFGADQRLLGWGFALFALGEISYLTYHLDWTVFLFAHTISEVLVFLGFAMIFTAVLGRASGRVETARL